MAMIPDERSESVPRSRMLLRPGLYGVTFLAAFVLSAIALLWVFWLYPRWLYSVREPKASNECVQVQIGMSRANMLKFFGDASVVPGYEAEDREHGDVLTFMRSDGSCYVELDSTGKTVMNRTFQPRSRGSNGSVY